MSIPDDRREQEIREREQKATEGPWAWACTAEKDYGAHVAAGVYAEADDACEHPLSGDLNERTDDYYVDEPIAEMFHPRSNADADFIAHARSDIPYLLDLVSTLRREADTLRERVEAGERDHREWALANVARYGDRRRCGHSLGDELITCFECAHEIGRRLGQVEAGAYHTHQEVIDTALQETTTKEER